MVIPGPGPAAGWAAAVSYGKIRTLHDGTVILPIIGRHGFLTSSDGGETWERYVTAACDRYSGDEADFLQPPERPHSVREPRSLQHPRARGRTAVLQLE